MTANDRQFADGETWISPRGNGYRVEAIQPSRLSPRLRKRSQVIAGQRREVTYRPRLPALATLRRTDGCGKAVVREVHATDGWQIETAQETAS